MVFSNSNPVELDRSAIKRDLKEFGRKIKCKAYFEYNSYNEGQESVFRQFREKSACVLALRN